MDVDVAIVGAGGAGLSLLLAIDRLTPPSSRTAPLTIALVDPVERRGNDRTWCFWDDGRSPVEAAVHRAWTQAAVIDALGRERRLDLAPLRYVMVRSGDFYDLAEAAVERLRVHRVTAKVDEIVDGDHPRHGVEGRALVLAGGEQLRARWVFDSSPAAPRLRGTTDWLQHFRGWTLRFTHDAFDPGLPVLMDFSVPQPVGGVAFGYVLPSDRRRGLVEYTQFSRARLASDDYDAALRGYLVERWGSGGQPDAYTIEEVEDGAIPMTDAVFARRVGPRTFRLGTAGGATRGSTGYTFSAMQRQAEAVARALLADDVPAPPPAYPARHRWMDAVMLRALDNQHTRGADLFPRLFERNPAERVLRFLDGATSPSEDLALMRTAPILPMTLATIGNAAGRVSRRLHP